MVSYKRQVYHRCAICDCKGTDREPVFPFEQLLRELRVDGKFAHPFCVANERVMRRAYRRKYGQDKIPAGKFL